MNEKDVTKEYISVAEAAAQTGYSRQHVLRLINSGAIQASRVGRSFVVRKNSLPGPLSTMSEAEEKEIGKAVSKVFKNYGEALKKLSKE